MNLEPKEKLAGVEDKVVENIHTKTEGVVQSTVKEVLQVAHSVSLSQVLLFIYIQYSNSYFAQLRVISNKFC